jgi:hypothetical protein
MHRGRLPASSCRHARVAGLQRPSGRTASPSGEHPINHHVAGPPHGRVVDRDTAGRPRAPQHPHRQTRGPPPTIKTRALDTGPLHRYGRGPEARCPGPVLPLHAEGRRQLILKRALARSRPTAPMNVRGGHERPFNPGRALPSGPLRSAQGLRREPRDRPAAAGRLTDSATCPSDARVRRPAGQCRRRRLPSTRVRARESA